MSRIAPAALSFAAVGTVAGLAHVGPGITWLAPIRLRWAPTLSGLGRAGHLGLTFDDGPHPAGTPAMLDALDRLGWRATFFLLGQQVRRMPQLAAQVVAAGHEVGVHGDQHRYLLTRTPQAAAADLARAVDSIHDATGTRPLYYRPPYGVLTSGGMRAARQLRLRTVLWSAWGRDWEPGATPASVVAQLTRGLLDGGTALLHDSDLTSAAGSWRTTAAALPRLADELAGIRVRPGPLAEHEIGADTC